MIQTETLKLNKIELSDIPDISVLNPNWEIVEKEIIDMKDRLDRVNDDIVDAGNTKMISNTDLDNLIENGVYVGENLTNSPISAGEAIWWYIDVTKGAAMGEYARQRATFMVGGSLVHGAEYVRVKSNGSWGQWKKQIDQDGGTLYGMLNSTQPMGIGAFCQIGTGENDVFVGNLHANRWLQLCNDGTLSYSNERIYHTGNKPTKADIGLGRVPDYPASDEIDRVEGAFATSLAVKTVNDKIGNISNLGERVDLDDIKTTGRYHQPSTAAAASGFNYPIGVAGLLIVYNQNYVYQEYQTYNGTGIWHRAFYTYASTWSSWKKIANDKGDIGLGSVNNYGIATTAEAQAGTATNKYMTPALVKDAINSLGNNTSVQTGTFSYTNCNEYITKNRTGKVLKIGTVAFLSVCIEPTLINPDMTYLLLPVGFRPKKIEYANGGNEDSSGNPYGGYLITINTDGSVKMGGEAKLKSANRLSFSICYEVA